MSSTQWLYKGGCAHQLCSFHFSTQASRLLNRPTGLSPLILRGARLSSTTTSSSPSVRPSLLRRILRKGVFAFFFTWFGFMVATAPAVKSYSAFMSPPSDDESLRKFVASDDIAAGIEEYIHNHPLSMKLRANPGWNESKPHLKYPDVHKKHSLTAGTLLGPGRFPVPPTVFCDEKNLVSLSYVSTDMCGHINMIHGGLIATMLDEGLGRLAFNSLPNRIGVTASLTVNYRNPVPAGSYLVLKGQTIKAEGRKVWVKGRLEMLTKDGTPGQLLAEAEGLFIEPKHAKMLPKIFQAQPAQPAQPK